jgi:hypothetical protein
MEPELFAAPAPEPGVPALLLAWLAVIGWMRLGRSAGQTTASR